MMIFDRKYETMPYEQVAVLQLERLQALLARLRRNVPRYRKLLGNLQVEALEETGNIPSTSPTDLADAFPYGMLALPLREVMRLHSTIGPGGKQLVIGHTRNDLTHWGRLTARQLVAAGVTSNDVIQICFSGSFGSALGYLLGAECIEASVIPQDAYHIEYQMAMTQNFRVNVLITTPGNARELMGAVQRIGIDPPSLHLRTIMLSRSVPDFEREELKTGLFADVRCGFGVSEVLDPGLCVECEEGHFHANEDQFLVEIQDGELLVTTLAREAMPLLRYRTRIACAMERIRCPCGRTGAVLKPGERLDGRLRVNEMPLYRVQVEALLDRTRAAGHPFLLQLSEHQIAVSIKVTEKLFSDTVRNMELLKNEIESEFFSRLGIRAVVEYLGPAEFDRLQKEQSPA